LFEPKFKIGVFGKSRAINERVLYILLDALVEIDELILRSIPGLPSLYRSGVRYQREPLGVEDWCDVLEVIRQGFADCEDLASWRVAELRVRHGINARPYVKKPKLVGPNRSVLMYHIQVQLPDGRIEDPSKRLGMGWEDLYNATPTVARSVGRRGVRRAA
jgi:hypothetical protein